MSTILDLSQVSHIYPNAKRATFAPLDLSIQKGELFCLLGPSGCGKSTLLQCIAGFEPLLSGSVRLNGQSTDGLPPEKREIGFVFQDYALFPHLTVSKNISYGLSKREDEQQEIASLLEKVGLSGYEKKYPHELSGGEQQRVAIARALARKPRLILFDEPFSNLDPDRRVQLRKSLKLILKNEAITGVFVTHDQDEAYELADRIAVMNHGHLEQIGTPEELYQHPQSEFIARFLGSSLFLETRVTGLNKIDTPLGQLSFPINPLTFPIGTDCLLYLPYQSLSLDTEQGPHEGVVSYRRFMGEGWSYDIEVKDLPLKVQQMPHQDKLGVGQKIFVHIDHQKLRTLFPKTPH